MQKIKPAVERGRNGYAAEHKKKDAKGPSNKNQNPTDQPKSPRNDVQLLKSQKSSASLQDEVALAPGELELADFDTTPGDHGVHLRSGNRTPAKEGLGPARSSHLHDVDPLTQYHTQSTPLGGRRPKCSIMFKRKQMFLDMIKNHKLKQKQMNQKFKRDPDNSTSMGEQSAADLTHMKPQKQMFQINDFQIQLQIGQGAFATVKRAIHKRTGHQVALKVYDKKHLKDTESSTALRREIYTLAVLGHKNIMSLHEVIDTRTNVYLVMELCEGKSLYHLIKKTNETKQPGLEEDFVRKVFTQIVEGVAFMHSKSIVHRDLKLDNILINQLGEVKIIDFGFAVKCDPKEKLSTHCGTPHYMDPDLVKKRPYQG